MLVLRILPRVSYKNPTGARKPKQPFSAIGVLRMVKLFGWENKMTEKLQQTRDEELYWLLKEKVR
jgi:hypothetical protein